GGMTLRPPRTTISRLMLGCLTVTLLVGGAPPHPVVEAQAPAALLPFPVAIAPGNQHRPAAYGDWVVWFDEMARLPVIRANDLRTREEIPVAVQPGQQGHPAVSGRVVVWQDDQALGAQIYARDLAAGETWALTPEPGAFERPLIAAGRVVWLDNTGGVPTIA